MHRMGHSSMRAALICQHATHCKALTWPFTRGAGDENRTRVASLEDWGSTIELHPQGRWPTNTLSHLALGRRPSGRGDRTRTCDLLLPKQTR
jgi:hypothetical protein